MNTHELLRLSDIFAESRGIALASLGTYMLRDAHFFDRLKSGRVTIRRAELALQWLSDHWPADRQWPEDIRRPDPSNEEVA